MTGAAPERRGPLAFLRRERRVLLLSAASALAHLLVLAAVNRSRPQEPASPASPSLQIVLTPGAAPIAAAAMTDMPAARVPLAAPAALADAAPAAAAVPPAELAGTAAGPAAADRRSAGWDFVADANNADTVHVPGFQAVQPPPSARLVYAVTERGKPAGTAALDWRVDGQRYQLTLGADASRGATGHPGVLGEINAIGQGADNGLVPLEARAANGVVRFDWQAARASFSRGLLDAGASAAIQADAQDPASMLLRLSAIGRASASQLDRGIELEVAGPGGVTRVLFEKIADAEEIIDTALGPMATVHLRQRVAAGQPCLEVWLAPAREWYPVQLRGTAADGGVVQQTVTAMTIR